MAEITYRSTVDLDIALTDDAASVIPGRDTVYSMQISNAGPSNAVNAVVSNDFFSTLNCSWACVGTGCADRTRKSEELSKSYRLVMSSVTHRGDIRFVARKTRRFEKCKAPKLTALATKSN